MLLEVVVILLQCLCSRALILLSRHNPSRVRLVDSITLPRGTLARSDFSLVLAATTAKTDQFDLSRKSFLERKEKSLNYEDEDVLCTSESGTWNYVPFTDEEEAQFKESIAKDEASAKESLLLADTVESWSNTLALLVEKFPATAEGAVHICDRIDQCRNKFRANLLLRFRRQLLLGEILRSSREDYIAVASFLGPRIPRDELPNLEGLPYPDLAEITETARDKTGFGVGTVEQDLVDDCPLPALSYRESILDKLLLSIFRKLVQKEINYKSETSGIRGLLEEGRHFMLSAEGSENDGENQHTFVKNVLGGLLTPVMPPFYRLFMSGIVPSLERGDPAWLVDASGSLIKAMPDFVPFKKDLVPGAQLGPWFYAPFLTSVVTPPFLSFLLGPSRPNLRRDGNPGGMVVQKCKFLQESNCKGLCLHQCKIPAQEFFQDSLGMPLTVAPNFETQECQWSWGQTPIPHSRDPDFPKGCISGCETRQSLTGVAVVAADTAGASSNSYRAVPGSGSGRTIEISPAQDTQRLNMPNEPAVITPEAAPDAKEMDFDVGTLIKSGLRDITQNITIGEDSGSDPGNAAEYNRVLVGSAFASNTPESIKGEESSSSSSSSSSADISDAPKLKVSKRATTTSTSTSSSTASSTSSTITAGTSSKKKKKVRARKDPNAPKGAMGSYMLFSQQERSKVLAERPGLGVAEVGKEVGARWRALDAEAKKPFEELARADKQRYETEMKDYQEKCGVKT